MESLLRGLQIMCLDLSKIHSSCGPKFWSNACIVNQSRICSASKSDFKNSYHLLCMSELVIWVTTEIWVRWRHLSCIKFLGRWGKILPTSRFIQEGQFCPEILIQRPVKLPISETHKSLTVLGRLMDHRKAERVTYRLVFGTFGVSNDPRPKS
jgi:hypothetical protein